MYILHHLWACTQIAEIFLIFPSFLIYHNLKWGWFPWGFLPQNCHFIPKTCRRCVNILTLFLVIYWSTNFITKAVWTLNLRQSQQIFQFIIYLFIYLWSIWRPSQYSHLYSAERQWFKYIMWKEQERKWSSSNLGQALLFPWPLVPSDYK